MTKDHQGQLQLVDFTLNSSHVSPLISIKTGHQNQVINLRSESERSYRTFVRNHLLAFLSDNESIPSVGFGDRFELQYVRCQYLFVNAKAVRERRSVIA
jgi:hypothetical protein